MRIAISIWEDKISPVLDTASKLLVIDDKTQKESSRFEADLFEEDFAHRPDYIYKYRHCYGFHPTHGLMTTYPLKRLRHANKVFVAGAESPAVIKHLGFEPTVTIEDAIQKQLAERGGRKVLEQIQDKMQFDEFLYGWDE